MLSALVVFFTWFAAASGQYKRLRIINGCPSEPMWIAHEGQFIPDPQNVRIEPMGYYDFSTEDGVASARYWPKMYCDDTGRNCGLGGSGGDTTQGCGQPGFGECAPPIDTKFEATFHAHDAANPGVEYDYVDVSLVDGFTLPFRLTMNGRCDGTTVIDCSGMTFDTCPAAEVLSSAGITTDLKLKNPTSGLDAGCYSPCTKLIAPQWNNAVAGGGRPATDPYAVPYCCPTPPESPSACRAGPGAQSQYVQTVHQMCPGVYGYAYDDGMGLIKCDTTTTYEMTYFCPSNIGQTAQGQSLPDIILRTFQRPFQDLAGWLQGLHGALHFPSLQATSQQPYATTPSQQPYTNFNSKDGAPVQHSRSVTLLPLLLAFSAIAMFMSLVAIVVRNWRRRASYETRLERRAVLQLEEEERRPEETGFLHADQSYNA